MDLGKNGVDSFAILVPEPRVIGKEGWRHKLIRGRVMWEDAEKACGIRAESVEIEFVDLWLRQGNYPSAHSGGDNTRSKCLLDRFVGSGLSPR